MRVTQEPVGVKDLKTGDLVVASSLLPATATAALLGPGVDPAVNRAFLGWVLVLMAVDGDTLPEWTRSDICIRAVVEA